MGGLMGDIFSRARDKCVGYDWDYDDGELPMIGGMQTPLNMDETMRKIDTRAVHRDPDGWRAHNKKNFDNIDKN